jgi:hypothetical protein
VYISTIKLGIDKSTATSCLVCGVQSLGNSNKLTYIAGDLKINRSFDVDFSAPGFATKLKLVALDLSGPGVVAIQFSASCFKNSDLHNSFNKVETIAPNQFPSPINLTGQQALFALVTSRFFFK